jgi:hypothetical protein
MFERSKSGWGGVPVSDVVVHVVFSQVEHVLGQHLRLPGVPQAQLRSQVQYLEDHRYMRPGTTKYRYLPYVYTWDRPTHTPASEYTPPPLPPKGRGTPAPGDGVEESQFGRLEEKP